MRWNERIKIARELRGLNKSAFARLAGVSTATTTDWEKGKIKMIDGEHLIKVASVLRVTPEWLMTGWGEKEAGEDVNTVVTNFAWVYRNVGEEGKLLLRSSIRIAADTYLPKHLRTRLEAVKDDRRK